MGGVVPVDALTRLPYHIDIGSSSDIHPAEHAMAFYARRLLVAAAFAITSAATHATVLYDNFGPGMAHDTQNAWIVGHTVDGGNYATYSSFFPTLSGLLSSAAAPVTWGAGALAPVRFEVFTDDGGRPGDVIAQALVGISANGGIVTGTFQGGASLSSQSRYWFGMSTTDPSTYASWHLNAVGALGQHAFTGALGLAPGEWFLQEATLGAFRLDGQVAAIPEPSNALLLALGFLLLAFKRRFPGMSRT